VLSVNDIRRRLDECRDVLRTTYHIRNTALFGSYRRGEQSELSDVDLLVEFDEVPSLIEVAGAEIYLAERLGVKVDLVERDAVRPALRKRIYAEAVPV
jgi:predicted nucleotidyltransferase